MYAPVFAPSSTPAAKRTSKASKPATSTGSSLSMEFAEATSGGAAPYSTWIRNCDAEHGQPDNTPGDVAQAHHRALSWLGQVSSQLPVPGDMAIEGTSTPLKTAAKRWYNLDTPRADPGTLGQWRHIGEGIDLVKSRASQTTYVCRDFSSAARAPRGLSLRLDRTWFWSSTRTVDQRAALLVHEWGHMWGGRYITPLFESYCTGSRFWTLGSARRVRLPDAYMGFVNQLVTGRAEPGGGLC